MQPDLYIYMKQHQQDETSLDININLRDTENVCTNMVGSLPHVQVTLPVYCIYVQCT